uniref:BBIP1 protein n=1 Tax=Taeniopygia guttata TaxID=59729 RepID=A0A674GQL4_TAEGU
RLKAAARRAGQARAGGTAPPQRQLSVEDTAALVLCKPKILPLKSVSLEKLEKLQRAALEAAQRRVPHHPAPSRAYQTRSSTDALGS